MLAILTGGLSAWGTFRFAQFPQIGAVRSSAILSLLVGLLFHFIPINSDFSMIPIVFIGGSFVGMTSVERISSAFQLFLTGMIFGAIYHYIVPNHLGLGGALGTSACLAVIVMLGLKKFNG